MTRRTSGLAILACLSLVDVAGPLMTDGEHPPMSVALAGTAIGLLSLAAISYVARGSRRAVGLLVVLRVVSAASAVPAFFIAGVPWPFVAFAAVFIVLTGVGLALARPSTSAPAVP
jgi:hypothetical protein